MENKRNTSKEKEKENKHFPYRIMFNLPKYRIVDSKGKSYGEFRERVNVDKEIKRLKKNYLSDDFMIEHLR